MPNALVRQSLKFQLLLPFGLLLLLVLALAAMAVAALSRSSDSLRAVCEDRAVPLQQLGEIHYLATRDRVILGDAITRQDANNTAKRAKEFTANRARSDALLAGYLAKVQHPDEAALARAVQQALAALVDQGMAPGFAALQANRLDDAETALLGDVSRLNPAFSKAIDALIALQVSGTRAEYESARSRLATVRLATVAVAGLALLLGASAALWQLRSITGQLGAEPSALAAVARRVAGGDLSDDGQAAAPAGSVLAVMQAMRASLAAVVAQVRQGVHSVDATSSLINRGNADLAARTEAQAGSLQQTAAAMEQIAATASQASDSTARATGVAGEASEAARRGGALVDKVVCNMADIQATSRKIAEITGVVDGIAFQTNILALNAAVEAARAGEQGRGFAVVAGEVRTLAQRSAAAAGEIKTLIMDSVDRVDRGNHMAREAGDSMHGIIAQVQQVRDLIQGVSLAANEQHAGMAQIGEAVSTLDQATQRNAALVEQSTEAAGALRAQAAALAGAVAHFQMA